MTRVAQMAACCAVSVLAAYPYAAHPLTADRVLTASPWAQQSAAIFALAKEEPPGPGPLPGAVQSGVPGNTAQNGTHWDGDVSRNNRGGTPTLNVLVRWDTAAPVMQALQETGQKIYSPEDVQKFYILTVVGLVPGGRYRSIGNAETQSRSDDSVDSHNPEEMLEELMTSSHLVIRGKGALAPHDVKLDAATGALHMFFPRTDPLTARDKEVVFYTRFGSMSVAAKFRLKDMVYRGKLEL